MKKVVLLKTLAAGNWEEEMGHHAHRLKGAGGSYRFEGLTEVADILEVCCKADKVDKAQLKTALDDVMSYLNRVRIRCRSQA